jgi:hypothetical protein
MNKKLRIGLDISNLSPDFYGGIDTYCDELINSLINFNKKIIFQIYLSREYFVKRKLKNSKNCHYIIVNNGFIKKIFIKCYNRAYPYLSILFGKFKYIIEYKIRNYIYSDFKKKVEINSDVLISPNVNLTVYDLNIPTILNMHDIQHIHYPHFFSFSELNRRNYRYLNSAKYCTNLVSSGEFIKKDMNRAFDFLKRKNFVIHEGVNLKKYQIETKHKRDFLNNYFKKKKIYPNNFIFFPAQLWEHKNHLTILESIKILNKKFNVKIKLVMCGKNYSNSKNIFNYIYNNKLDDFIVYLGVINFEEKKWLFRNSFATICPALYESSSLVNLEAIASKTSVISSDIPTNIEKSKVFKINIFKKRDSYDFANKVIFLIKNSNLKKEQIKYNYSIIKSWDWHYVSNKYLLVCRNILKDFR